MLVPPLPQGASTHINGMGPLLQASRLPVLPPSDGEEKAKIVTNGNCSPVPSFDNSNHQRCLRATEGSAQSERQASAVPHTMPLTHDQIPREASKRPRRTIPAGFMMQFAFLVFARHREKEWRRRRTSIYLSWSWRESFIKPHCYTHLESLVH